jgi:Flp pilus assembly protein TadG
MPYGSRNRCAAHADLSYGGRLARRARRGAAAIEFALVLPVLFALLTATFDYGWFYLREGLVTSVLREAVRAGSYQKPSDSDVAGACSACASRAASVAVAELSGLGIVVSAADMTPTIENIAGTCALVLEPSIPHRAVVGLVPVPSAYSIRVVAHAQNVSGC